MFYSNYKRFVFSFTLTLVILTAFSTGISAKEDPYDGNYKIPKSHRTYINDLKSSSIEKKKQALISLRDTGPNAAEVISSIVPLLKDQNYWVRTEATLTIIEIGPAASSAVENLRYVWNSGSDSVLKSHVANALGAIGPEASDAIPELKKGLDSKEDYIVSDSAAAIGNIGDTSSVEQIANIYKKTPDNKKIPFALALYRLTEDEEYIEFLVDQFKKDDMSNQLVLTDSIARARVGQEDIVKGLIGFLQNSTNHRNVRSAAAVALGKIGPVNDQVLPALYKILKKEANLNVQASAATALGYVGPVDDTIKKNLRKAAKGANPFLTIEAKKALLKM